MEDIILSYTDSNAHDLDIDIVYRHFHTLKAGFGSFKIDDVVRRIHELETYFNQYKEKNKTLRLVFWYKVFQQKCDRNEFSAL